MSTSYNRRRGAKANTMRKPRICAADLTNKVVNPSSVVDGKCIKLAQRNRYCIEHQQKTTVIL
jgi:hypothetical protein